MCLKLAGVKLGRNDGLNKDRRHPPHGEAATLVSQTQLAGLETDG
jgi:hypothetical protein